MSFLVLERTSAKQMPTTEYQDAVWAGGCLGGQELQGIPGHCPAAGAGLLTSARQKAGWGGQPLAQGVGQLCVEEPGISGLCR